MKLFSLLSFFLLSFSYAQEKLPGKYKNSGLIMGKNWEYVQVQCTICHSASIITQSRMSRETWKDTIHWMQKTQGLWPLGESEALILDYLSTYYKPQMSGRRKNLPAHLMP
jgi:hypothetical protein